MPRLRIPRPTYASVMATAAMFVALGGTSYAVSRIPKASVGTDQLKDGAVTAGKLAPGTAISGPRGPRGAQGPDGAAGAQGPSDAWIFTGANAQLSTVAGNRSTPINVTTLPPGNYVLTGAANIGSWEQVGFVGFCAIAVNGGDVISNSGVVGTGGGSTRRVPIAMTTAVTLGTASRVTFQCWPDQSLTPAPWMNDVRLTAIQVGALHK